MCSIGKMHWDSDCVEITRKLGIGGGQHPQEYLKFGIGASEFSHWINLTWRLRDIWILEESRDTQICSHLACSKSSDLIEWPEGFLLRLLWFKIDSSLLFSRQDYCLLDDLQQKQVPEASGDPDPFQAPWALGNRQFSFISAALIRFPATPLVACTLKGTFLKHR